MRRQVQVSTGCHYRAASGHGGAPGSQAESFDPLRVLIAWIDGQYDPYVGTASFARLAGLVMQSYAMPEGLRRKLRQFANWPEPALKVAVIRAELRPALVQLLAGR